MALLLAGLIHGVPRDEVLSPTWEPLQQLRVAGLLHPAIDEIAAGSFRDRQPPQIVGNGYVVQSLEAALWAFHDAQDYRIAVLKAVNLGNDADTTGAVCGQFAGAYPGSPDETKHRQRIEELWDAGMRTFVNLVEENETNNNGQPFSRYDDILRELAGQAGEQVSHLRFPVRDLSVPSLDGMRSILDTIDLSLAAERAVYLHCFGGVGRTGTAVCC